MNIQRGRDHELPSYNDVREALGLGRADSFYDITSDHKIAEKLKHAYDHVDDIDLWIGGLAEDHKPGSSVGETFTTIIQDQFERLRAGDRFWYQNSLSKYEIDYVEGLRLSDIIRMNTGAQVAGNVFFADENAKHYV